MSVPAERRRYDRYAISLRGRLARADGRQSSCLVRDYCSGGMLVQLLRSGEGGKREPAFRVGQSLQLITEILTGTGSRAIQISADVAWIRDEYLGLSFPRTSDAVVEALRRHDRLARPQTLPESDHLSGGAARSLAKMRHVAQGVLPGLLHELLLMTEESLLGQADRVSSNSEQQQIYGDMSALEGLHPGDSLKRAVLSRAFDPATAATEPGPPADELSLVDSDEFERWLEASRVESMLDRKFNTQLSAIGSRLVAIGAGGAPGTFSVPFEPQHFTSAFKELAQDLELGRTARSTLFGCAGSLLAEKLGSLYAELDAALDASGAPAAKLGEGVTPLRPAKAKSKPGADQDRCEVPGPAVAPAPPSDRHSAIAASGEGAGAGPIAMDPGLLAALLARETRQREILADELMTLVSAAPGMTESLETWLKQLGEPLAREAVADQAFFQNKHHPLREIVDGLGHLQMFRPTPDLSPADDPLQQRVTEILQPISNGETDPPALRSVADAVRNLVSDHSSQYQRNVERVVELYEGRDRVRQARKAVLTEIERRYAGRRVPEVISELLDMGWRGVMELAALNSGEGSDSRYVELLGLLDSLVASLGGEAFEHEPSEPDANRLFVRIAKELTTVAFDPIRRNAVETRLRRELAAPAQQAADLVVMPEPGHEPEQTESSVPPDGVSEKAWRQANDRCMALSVGDRVRLLDEKGDWQELRIAWVRGDQEVFALVDYRGLRMCDIRLAELALGLHQHRIQLSHSDGRALSDRGVDAMLERMEERLAHQAAHDSLTGLINRQQFHAALEQTLAIPGRGADIGVVLWIDIDQFRLVNDIHGYDTGDRVLVTLARLLEQVEGAKVLGHLGADRFAVMLPDIGLGEGELRARGICESVRDIPFDWSGQAIPLSVSVGVAGMFDAHGGFSHLLQAADDALAAAKAAGGDRDYVYRVDDPEIARRKESVRWVVKVDEALDRGQLRLRCQPIVPVRPDCGLSPHYEVLLGVHNGAAEPLPIAEFIDAAERYNRMRAVDRWVAQTVIEWVAAHREHMPALHGFAVNLSGQTASDPSFVDFVRQQFQRTGIDPSWLSFEVTETAAVADLTRSAGIIRDLKSMGCKVALDDFGSGLASYSYLKELPVDWLKIDGVFVRKIAADREDHAVVKSINEIGHFLGKKTIAEYVADEEILRLVREIGVDYAQGFGISPPLLMDELLQTLVVASTG